MNLKKFGIILTIWTILSSSAMAQLGIPKINGKKSEKIYEDAITLQNIKIDVDIVGNIATTTFDMIFKNSSWRTLEGEFDFALEEGQTVSRYALDINGKLREGVIVDKEKGRTTFESKVRENIDPGLLEMTAGNNFRTRIYPFNENSPRHIVVACEQELTISNGKRYYRLPINTKTTVEKFDLEINVYNETNEPIVGKESLDGIQFKQSKGNYIASFSRENYDLSKGLFLEIPTYKKATVYTENIGEENYFYLYSAMTPKSIKREKPKNIAVIYDVSNSSENRNLKKDLDLLDAYIKHCGITNIHLITFSNEKHIDKQCSINEIKKEIHQNKFDGATKLDCLNFSEIKEDEILLYTDGLSNFGKDIMNLPQKPIYIINSSAFADHSQLKSIAQKTGGAYINICNMTQDEAFNALSNKQYKFIRAQYDNNISEVYPSIPTAVTESFSVSGLMKAKDADITLYFGFGDKITDTIKCHVSAVESTNNIRRMWAQKKLAELDINYEKNEKTITELSKKYGIVTRNTSLIVLESVNDYIKYKITPPDELKEEYDNILKQRKEERRNRNNKHLEEYYLGDILYEHNEFKEWWITSDLTDEELMKYEEKEERKQKKIENRENKKLEKERKSRKKKLEKAKKRNIKKSEKEAKKELTRTDFEGLRNEIKNSVKRNATRIIRGVVKEINDPLPFANIIIKGTTVGTNTDMDGQYELEVSEGDILEFSYPGYEKQTRKITPRTGSILNVTLSEELLEELVVTGYGCGTPIRTKVVEVESNSIATPSVELQEWNPDIDYITHLKTTDKAKLYETYLDMKHKYHDYAPFYIDVAGYFYRENLKKEAIRIVSNLVEMKLDDAEVARSCANKLAEFKCFDMAAVIFEDVIKMRGEEPQSYRDLALVYWDMGKYQEAADLLYEVASNHWDPRFDNIQQIAIHELNALIAISPKKIKTSKYDKRLLGKYPMDIRITLSWNTNDSDMDLWVIDPQEEKCYYSNRETEIGGRMSNDFREGYGPEEFCLKKAIEGEYKIQVNYYGTDSQKMLQPVVVQATIYTNFGRKNQEKQVLTLQLGEKKDVYTVGTITFKK